MIDRNNYQCSFCGKSNIQVNRLIQGQNGCICDFCVKVCNKILENEEIIEKVPVCSFCGKTEKQVKTLIFHGKSYICDECLKACNENFAARSNI